MKAYKKLKKSISGRNSVKYIALLTVIALAMVTVSIGMMSNDDNSDAATLSYSTGDLRNPVTISTAGMNGTFTLLPNKIYMFVLAGAQGGAGADHTEVWYSGSATAYGAGGGYGGFSMGYYSTIGNSASITGYYNKGSMGVDQSAGGAGGTNGTSAGNGGAGGWGGGGGASSDIRIGSNDNAAVVIVAGGGGGGVQPPAM